MNLNGLFQKTHPPISHVHSPACQLGASQAQLGNPHPSGVTPDQHLPA